MSIFYSFKVAWLISAVADLLHMQKSTDERIDEEFFWDNPNRHLDTGYWEQYLIQWFQ